MKNIILFTFFIYPLFLNAQETDANISNAQRFCLDSGKSIKGQVLYSENYYTYLFGTHAQGISLTKFIDERSSDSIYALTFFGDRELNFYHKGESGTIYKPYKVMLDYEESDRIIAWIEYVTQELKNDSQYNFYSFTPKKSDFLIYVNKKKNGLYWKVGIQYDKFDASSAEEFNISNINDLYLKLKELQKAKV